MAQEIAQEDHLTIILYHTIDDVNPVAWIEYLVAVMNAGVGKELQLYIFEDVALEEQSPLLAGALSFYTTVYPNLQRFAQCFY